VQVTRFEDLIAWQKARELRKLIYRASADKPFWQDFEMRDQIRGAALSVMSNIAEGFERDRLPEFLYLLRVARASCGEVRSQLYAAFDEGYLTDCALQPLLERTGEVGRIIRGLERSLLKKLGTRH
jgi:four helix bundle protein